MKLPDSTYKGKLEQQHGRCYYCGDSLTDCRIEIDHFIPKSKGGNGCNYNLVLTCRDCNRKKLDRPLEYLREYLSTKNKLIRGLFYFEFINI